MRKKMEAEMKVIKSEFEDRDIDTRRDLRFLAFFCALTSLPAGAAGYFDFDDPHFSGAAFFLTVGVFAAAILFLGVHNASHLLLALGQGFKRTMRPDPSMLPTMEERIEADEKLENSSPYVPSFRALAFTVFFAWLFGLWYILR